MQIHFTCRRLFTRNISFDYARETSVWYDAMPVITMATDLPHEIEPKCKPVHQPASLPVRASAISWPRTRISLDILRLVHTRVRGFR